MTTQTLDLSGEPAKDLSNGGPSKWLAWWHKQVEAWGECSCLEVDPDHSPFDAHLDVCPWGQWEAAYRAARPPEVKVVPMGDKLESYLTPLTEVYDLKVPAAAYQRSDGATLLPEGKLSALHGMPSIGKSFVALEIVRSVARRGGRVLWWDFEDTAETLRGAL